MARHSGPAAEDREGDATTRAQLGADAELLGEIVTRLVRVLAPERIYLFGSRARGDADSDSDYDLLLVVPEREDRPERMELRASRALRGIEVPVDVVIVSRAHFDWMLDAPASLPATVQREGRLVYAA